MVITVQILPSPQSVPSQPSMHWHILDTSDAVQLPPLRQVGVQVAEIVI